MSKLRRERSNASTITNSPLIVPLVSKDIFEQKSRRRLGYSIVGVVGRHERSTCHTSSLESSVVGASHFSFSSVNRSEIESVLGSGDWIERRGVSP